MKIRSLRPTERILELNQIPEKRLLLQANDRKVVLTNGCFDLLHRGHVQYLNEAAELGGILFVGINSDEMTRELKGEGRPVINEYDRAYLLASLECVDFVFIFRTKHFERPLAMVCPDIYVKGGDYNIDTIVQTERTIMEALDIKIEFIPLVEGLSTTIVKDRIVKGVDAPLRSA